VIEYARTLFAEQQRFTQWWLWVMLSLPVALSIGFSAYFLAHLSIFSRRLHLLLMVMSLSFITPILFFGLRMSVVVTSQHLTARFVPLRRRIAISDIASFRVLTYTIRDFGGWGIKWARDGTLVLNVSGNRAVRINRRKGKSLILGTQRPDEFAAALTEMGVPREPD